MGFEILSLCNPDNDPWLPLHIGQRTGLIGEPGLFVVVGLDRDAQTADIIASAGITPVRQHVPFAKIRPLGMSRAFNPDERILPFRS